MGKLIKGVNDLASVNPDLASEWHPTKNINLSPDKVTYGSKKKAWWVCKKGHEWQATIGSRSSGNGCPFCSGQMVITGVNDLQTVNPDLASEWHPTKNVNLSPDKVTYGSGKKAWWVCKHGHEWQATIASRSNGSGCPICSGKKVLTGLNDLQTVNPDLASEWHPTKNVNLSPDQVTCGCNKKVWWVCYKGHEWQATIINRSYGSGCPVCASGKQTSFNEQAIYYYLKSLFPDTANRYLFDETTEIDVFLPEKNIGIEYDGYWWHLHKAKDDVQKVQKCKSGGIRIIRVREPQLPILPKYIDTIILKSKSINEIENAIKTLINMIEDSHGSRIEISIKRDRISILNAFIHEEKQNSIASSLPKLAAEWNFTRNKELLPEHFSAYSVQAVWWICKLGHEWQATIGSRSRGNGCPYCCGKKVLAGFNDLQTVNPELASEWHQTKNVNSSPDKVTYGSGKKAWWICKLGHEWQATIGSRSSGNGCPICNGKIILTGFNDLQTVNPDLASEWHPTKNVNLSPDQVTCGSDIKAWWVCKLGHEWQATIGSRSRGSGCPFCSGQIVITGLNDLQTVNPDLASEWHPTKNFNLSPDQVTCGSNKKVWWVCKKGHEWQSIISNRSNGSGCPFCCGKMTLAGFNDLQTVNPDLASEWHPTKNFNLSPAQVTCGSNKKVWWVCKHEHEWQATIKARSIGVGCPICCKENRNNQ